MITRQACIQGRNSVWPHSLNRKTTEEKKKLLIPISWRVAVGPPERTPPPLDLASTDIMCEASEPARMPEEPKPALWTFRSAIFALGGV